MKLKIDKSFVKDTNKIKDTKILQRIAVCIEQVISSENKEAIINLKKLVGFKHHYRIRIGDYRIGAIITDEEVIFERFINRKDMYKYYP